MSTRYTVTCDDDQARAIAVLARRYGITEEAVVRQLIDHGLDDVGEQRA